ncbi:cyclin-dependent kinase 11B isoform X3 [Carassius auratus]|uniref:cyclin-dependent kinase n=1 Tax=Carassius auratus TaxID=7957 RepID=A0A6P6Q0B5_CARAU|nr:cyclin-dependent kinase 11B-like isoform X3 [Carassius auratus]XP_052418868.1 cyclin-dependent kinase 11B isoform X3 [Carassius gibelio]
MGDEKETWKVKTLDEILQEKKRRRELEEKSDPKRPKNTDDRESTRDTPEEGELRDNRMEITIRNSPYTREDSTEDRDRLEQLERQRERERKLREQQQKEQRELKERERREEERRKQREPRRDGPVSHHRGAPADEYTDKGRSRHRSRSRSRSPARQQREVKAESSEQHRVREVKMDDKNPLSELQDISDSERKTTTPESSMGSGSEEEEGEENEEEESSSQSEGEEEGESGSDSEGSEHSEGAMSDEEQSEEEGEDRENGNHIPPMVTVPESRFDHDSEVSVEEEEEEEAAEEAGDVTPQSPSHSATPEDHFIPESPPISPVELKKELPKYLPALQGCRSVEEFQCLNRIEEGTYGVVYRAKDKKTDEIVALKRLKMEKEKEGFPITSLREINTILKAQHPNIVTVREIVVGSNMDKIYIVMNYVEHDLKSLMETMKQPFLPGEVKTLMIQLLRGVRHLHDNWILHRDLKTSNLLLSHKGILKIGDFGLAREYGSPLKPYTPVVVTLWYRSPDLLLGAKEYSTAVDMWSVGCIFGELLTQKPLFPGKSEIDQINKVFKDLGSPSEKIWPGYSELPAVKKMTFTEYPYNNLRKRFGALLSDQGFDLMNKFLTYCPAKRISADEALKHEYFRESPLPIEPSMFPTWPAKSEQQRVKRGTSPRPPEGGQDFSQLGDDDLKETGFHLTTANQGASKAGPGFSLKF